MLKSLHIKNFRGLRDLKIESLKRVNLITGQNNTGKTGVLEALALLLDEPGSKFSANLQNLFRSAGGDNIENFWNWLFHNKDLEKIIEIKASDDSTDNFGIQLYSNHKPQVRMDNKGRVAHPKTFGDILCYRIGDSEKTGHKPAIFSTHPSNPIQNAVDYNRVVSKRRKKQVEGMLRQIEPRLESIEALQISRAEQNGAPLIYAEITGLSEMIPVTQLGQGFNRLLDIYSELVAGDAKVLLVDEIENGLHHSVLPLIWKGLFLAAKEFDVQIFATTHSWECILAADQAAREQEAYDLELIRLDPVKGDIKATIIDQDALETAKEFKWEMR